MYADGIEGGQGSHAAIKLQSLLDWHPELTLPQAGRDIGGSLRIDIGIDAQRYAGTPAEPGSHRMDGLEFLRGLHIKEQDVSPERRLDLLGALAYPGEHNALGSGPGM